jgi:nucleotide-binding universal stress UspA family protein
VVYAFLWPYLGVPLGPSTVGPPEGGLLHDAERIVETAVARARSTAPDIQVTGATITGAPVPLLIEQSRTAALVVVGDRGLGGFTGLLVGSVAVQLAAHAACPVLVARGRTTPAGDVLVGVDGSPANDSAIGFAFEEAALRGCALTAVHAWIEPLVHDLPEVEDEQARVLAEALAGWHDKYPDVVVVRRLVHARVRPTLIDATRHAPARRRRHPGSRRVRRPGAGFGEPGSAAPRRLPRRHRPAPYPLNPTMAERLEALAADR